MKKHVNFRDDLVGMQDELHRFAYKLTANQEDADDLVQETSIKALDNESKYASDSNFKGWVYTIMRNLFVNNYRKVIREQTYIDKTENQYYLSLPDNAGFDSVENGYDLNEMRHIVNLLPSEYKIPFTMYVAGFKYREIANKLNLPLGTIKSRIFFTRHKLQNDLRDFNQ